MNPPPDPTPPAPTTPANPAAPAPVPTRAEYEFDEVQNKVIDELASAMGWAAIPLVVVGVVQILLMVGHIVHAVRGEASHVWPAFTSLAAVVFFLFMGTYVRKAAEAFARIPTTAGSDVTHLMAGLDNLRKSFGLIALLVQLYLLVLLVAGVVFVIRAVVNWAG